MTVRIQSGDFNVSDELKRLCSGRTDIGACVTFTGVVRGESGGEPLVDMTLEHYPGMTEAELQGIDDEANRRWQLKASLIIHRVGKLAPSEQIVLVITASEHRRSAFEAAEFIMDYLKSDAPFWKKETRAGRQSRWVSCRESDADAKTRWKGR